MQNQISNAICDESILWSSHRRYSVRKGVLINFAKFTWAHLCHSLFLIKLYTGRPVTLSKRRLWLWCFPVKFCEIFKNIFFIEHHWAIASVFLSWAILILRMTFWLNRPSFGKFFGHKRASLSILHFQNAWKAPVENMYVFRSATLLKMTLLQRCQLSGFSNLEHYSKMDQNCNWYFKVNTFTGVFQWVQP